VTDWPRYLLR